MPGLSPGIRNCCVKPTRCMVGNVRHRQSAYGAFLADLISKNGLALSECACDATFLSTYLLCTLLLDQKGRVCNSTSSTHSRQKSSLSASPGPVCVGAATGVTYTGHTARDVALRRSVGSKRAAGRCGAGGRVAWGRKGGRSIDGMVAGGM